MEVARPGLALVGNTKSAPGSLPGVLRRSLVLLSSVRAAGYRGDGDRPNGAFNAENLKVQR